MSANLIAIIINIIAGFFILWGYLVYDYGENTTNDAVKKLLRQNKGSKIICITAVINLIANCLIYGFFV